MIPRSQMDLAKLIAESWRRKNSNFIIVTPPMSGDRGIIDLLASRPFLYEVLEEESSSFRVANIDSANVRDELSFANSVAKAWGVSPEADAEDDAVTILEQSCERVVRQKLIPILIVQRFHEALDRLGENIGTALRNLEHSHRLKTVVTMPVKLTTLRERWEVMNRVGTPFLASDWGQGHSVKVLQGYTRQELVSLFESQGKTAAQAEIVHNATGGLKQLIDRLADEIGNKQGQGLERFLRAKSVDLCDRIVKWFDATNSSQKYKKSLVNMMSPSLYQNTAGLIATHDWASIILDKNGGLTFKMLAWACYQHLAQQPSHSWLPTLSGIIRKQDFLSAGLLIEEFAEIDERNGDYWRLVKLALDFSNVGEKLFSEDVDWQIWKKNLDLLRGGVLEFGVDVKYISALDSWEALFKFLDEFHLHKRVHQNIRLERYVCEKISRDNTFVFFQLLRLRLHVAKGYQPFQGVQSIVTMPESILQIYAYLFFDMAFWSYDGLGGELSSEFESFLKRQYKIHGRTLGYSDLAHLISFFSHKSSRGRMLVSPEKLAAVLQKYEMRKELTHSTAFTSSEGTRAYQDFCEELLSEAETDLNIQSPHLEISPFYSIADELLKRAPLASSL